MAGNSSSGDYSKPYGDTPFYVGANSASGGVNSQYSIPDATRKAAAMKKLMQVDYDNANAKTKDDINPLSKLSS